MCIGDFLVWHITNAVPLDMVDLSIMNSVSQLSLHLILLHVASSTQTNKTEATEKKKTNKSGKYLRV